MFEDGKCICDYLQDTLELAMECAWEKIEIETRNQEDSMQKDINILELIVLKIERYLKKIVYISDLIYDLESYLNQLSTVDNQWKKDFRTIWLDIEVAYSLALDEGLENLTEEGAILTETSLLDLKKMTQNKIIDLNAHKNK